MPVVHGTVHKKVRDVNNCESTILSVYTLNQADVAMDPKTT